MLNKLFKKNYKVLIGLVIGLMISASAVYVYSATYNADAVFYNNAGTNITSNNVKGALDELNNNCKVFSNVKLGDFVIYNPTKSSYVAPTAMTGYDTDQTIHPSTNLAESNYGQISGNTLWRVININSDGTVEIISYRATSEKIKLSGKDGIVNAIATLNDLAGAYETLGITVGHRHFGYSTQTQIITDTTFMTTSASSPHFTCGTDNSGCNNAEYLGGGDKGYTQDLNLLTQIPHDSSPLLAVTASNYDSTNYWVASRYYYNPGYWEYQQWRLRVTSASGELSTSVNLYGYSMYSGEFIFESKSYEAALRPIVTLASGLTWSGAGVSYYPWVVSQ